MKESHELFLMRFRYGRAAEILLAYKTFLNRQVHFGREHDYCQSMEHVEQTTHTLLITYYSFVHSLFDKRGTDFRRSIEPYVEHLSDDAKEARMDLLNVWEQFGTPITILRSNIGFHGSGKFTGFEAGYKALGNIHPQVPDLIMNQLCLIFQNLDEFVEPLGNSKHHIDPEDKERLIKRGKSLKNALTDPEYNKRLDEFLKFIGEQEEE